MRDANMLKIYSLGLGLLMLANFLWIFVLRSETYPRLLVYLLQSIPIIAAFVVAYLSPRKKFFWGTSMAIPGAVFTAIANILYEVFGLPVDFPGLRGGITLLGISLASNFVLCALGSAVACFFTSRTPHNR